MKTLFSREMLANCVASVDDIDKAKRYGKIFVSNSIDGTITSYLWDGIVYVADIKINPETERVTPCP